MMQFTPGLSHPKPAHARRWVMVNAEGQILQNQLGQFLFDHPLEAPPESDFLVGQLSNGGRLIDCYCRVISNSNAGVDDCEWVGLRKLLMTEDEALFLLTGAAVQLASWVRDHKFCGRCGGLNEALGHERAMRCHRCDLHHYPRLSPCIIALITRGNECLLAVHKRSKVPMHTALAGFVEPGESLEMAVQREAFEEVGLHVVEPRYVGSQPWPFPGQMMMGFHTQLAPNAGPIRLQDDEIDSAGWYRFDQLPELIPPVQSLSGQLIAKFVANCQQHYQ